MCKTCFKKITISDVTKNGAEINIDGFNFSYVFNGKSHKQSAIQICTKAMLEFSSGIEENFKVIEKDYVTGTIIKAKFDKHSAIIEFSFKNEKGYIYSQKYMISKKDCGLMTRTIYAMLWENVESILSK